MQKADMSLLFDDLKTNNDKGARAYRVAEGLGPITGSVAPVDDTDLALYNGHLFITDAGVMYFASNVTDSTTTWTQLATA